MKYRYTYSQPLDVYRIWDGEHWIADAHSLFNAELIVNALCNFTPANSSAASKPDPSQSTNGNRQHSTPDAIEPPSSVQQPSQNCSQAGSDNLAEMSTTRNSDAAAAIVAAVGGERK